MGRSEITTQHLAAINAASMEGEDSVRWNPLKTIALVTVSTNGYVITATMN
jgi:hypothetical protein